MRQVALPETINDCPKALGYHESCKGRWAERTDRSPRVLITSMEGAPAGKNGGGHTAAIRDLLARIDAAAARMHHVVPVMGVKHIERFASRIDIACP